MFEATTSNCIYGQRDLDAPTNLYVHGHIHRVDDGCIKTTGLVYETNAHQMRRDADIYGTNDTETHTAEMSSIPASTWTTRDNVFS